MNIINELNEKIWEMDTQNRVQVMMQYRKDSKVPNAHLVYMFNKATEIQRMMIESIEEQILSTNDIFEESLYKVLIQYYKNSTNKNLAVITKLKEQIQKNKFKKFLDKDLFNDII